MLRAALGTALVILVQAAAISFLYNLRVMTLWGPADSDWLVFVLPSLLSILAGGAIFWNAGIVAGHAVLRGILATLWGGLTGAIGLECAFLFAFNRWGT